MAVRIRPKIGIAMARQADVPEIVEIFLSARAAAMPYIDDRRQAAQAREWFAQTVGNPPEACWIATLGPVVGGYMALWGEHLDDLYVRPALQRLGLGAALIAQAKALRPSGLELRTSRRNGAARAFYEAQGFAAAGFSLWQDPDNDRKVRYVWRGIGGDVGAD
jgi:ribosomal protein S18 acetylase RimI-like enzyme